MSDSYDAIVIGAGVIGANTALALARHGFRTLAVDRLPAAGYGSTSASCAIIRTHYSTLDGTALAWESLHHWLDWRGYLGVEDERGMAHYTETGCLMLITPGIAIHETWRRNFDALGIPWQEWTLDQVHARYPRFDLHLYGPVRRPADQGFGEPTGGEISGGFFMPRAGWVDDPQLATHNAQVAAQAAGASFRFNTEVTEIRTAQGRVAGVTFADETRVDAPVVVNVGGPHSSKLNAMAGVEAGMSIRTRALRQEVPYVPAPEGFDASNGCVLSDGDVGCYARPSPGGQLAIGSQDPDCDPHVWVDDPDSFDDSLSDQATAQVMRMAQRMPTLGIPGQLRGVAAMYDASNDWIPIYDKSDLPGFYMACGTSGNQFKNAPVAGQLMAALIEACENGRDHDADPVWFDAPRTGVQLNIGFYSRRREVVDSSMSVLG